LIARKLKVNTEVNKVFQSATLFIIKNLKVNINVNAETIGALNGVEPWKIIIFFSKMAGLDWTYLDWAGLATPTLFVSFPPGRGEGA
jgi:hypothetical protein